MRPGNFVEVRALSQHVLKQWIVVEQIQRPGLRAEGLLEIRDDVAKAGFSERIKEIDDEGFVG